MRTSGPQLCWSQRVRRAVGQKLLGQQFEWRVLDATIIAMRGPVLGSVFGVPFLGPLNIILIAGPEIGPQMGPQIWSPRTIAECVFSWGVHGRVTGRQRPKHSACASTQHRTVGDLMLAIKIWCFSGPLFWAPASTNICGYTVSHRCVFLS